ncbi:MAG: glutathione S-transferase family protein [Sandaracinus sp.]|nr:glutathione S-transferase family protein [Sandaracinus sp.]MCB9636155.1 glutathione S-transferase family protein [Sandaracinus sp.]
MKLYVGTKNLSSWSMRAWLALREADLPFEEEVVRLDTPSAATRLPQVSPSSLVPVLEVDETLTIWDTLAIAEWVTETTDVGWPRDPTRRAIARSACAEMHSGFAALRQQMPMDLHGRHPTPPLEGALRQNVDRVLALWETLRGRAADGPYLLGEWTHVDNFFAPVVTRFSTYGVELPSFAQAYSELVLARPSVQRWFADAKVHPWSL